MKSIVSLSLLCALVSAVPAINRRQEMVTDTDNDVVKGECKPTTFIFARGSTEDGNLGPSIGAPLCNMLRSAKLDGGVACQGVGGDYKAELAPNLLAKGTDDASIKAASDLMQKAMSDCPDTKILTGGYGQGTAVMMNAIKQLSSDEKARIQGVVLYGYTMNDQTGGRIPTFPNNQLKVFCRDDDSVCSGTPLVTPGHFAYQTDGTIDKGTKFLLNKVKTSPSPNSGGSIIGSLLGANGNSDNSGSSSGSNNNSDNSDSSSSSTSSSLSSTLQSLGQ